MSDEPFNPDGIEIGDASHVPDSDPIVPDSGSTDDPPGGAWEKTPPPKPKDWRQRFELIKGGVRDDKEQRRKERPVPPKPREGSLVKQLEQFYAGIGLMVAPFDMQCGTAIVNNATPCAVAMEEWARENPKVRALIMQASEMGTVGKVIAAHLPIVTAIMMHHTPMGALRMETGPNWVHPGAEGDDDG